MKILIVCTGNSARSQMAEGFFRHYGGASVEVASAGTQPKGLNPLAVKVMKEMGIDISHHRSKDIAEFVGRPFDWVITVCDHAKESCPVFPGAQTRHWNVQDPSGEKDFRNARDLLKKRVKEFLSLTDTAEMQKVR